MEIIIASDSLKWKFTSKTFKVTTLRRFINLLRRLVTRYHVLSRKLVHKFLRSKHHKLSTSTRPKINTKSFIIIDVTKIRHRIKIYMYQTPKKKYWYTISLNKLNLPNFLVIDTNHKCREIVLKKILINNCTLYYIFWCVPEF